MLKKMILSCVRDASIEAFNYMKTFSSYEYIWLEDKNSYLNRFLNECKEKCLADIDYRDDLEDDPNARTDLFQMQVLHTQFICSFLLFLVLFLLCSIFLSLLLLLCVDNIIWLLFFFLDYLQIENWLTVFERFEKLENQHTIHGWLLIDLKPFKHLILNQCSKWVNMFKDHLLDYVLNHLNVS